MRMSNVLDKICDDKRVHIAACKAATSLSELEARAKDAGADAWLCPGTLRARGGRSLRSDRRDQESQPEQRPDPRGLRSAGDRKGL